MSEVAEMLRVQYDYIDGKLSLQEAITEMQACGSECTRETIEKLLRDSPRDNVVQFHGSRFEDEV